MQKRSKRKRRGLLPKDHSPINVVPPEKREFWQHIPKEASIETAPQWRVKWSDEEVKKVILADPKKDTYESLARGLGRTPGAIRLRRAQMLHILRGDPYAREYVESTDHRRADWRQVHRVLKELGYLGLPVTEQFRLAVHLGQPSSSWRGDFTQTVLKEKRARRIRIRKEIEGVRNEKL